MAIHETNLTWGGPAGTGMSQGGSKPRGSADLLARNSDDPKPDTKNSGPQGLIYPCGGVAAPGRQEPSGMRKDLELPYRKSSQAPLEPGGESGPQGLY